LWFVAEKSEEERKRDQETCKALKERKKALELLLVEKLQQLKETCIAEGVSVERLAATDCWDNWTTSTDILHFAEHHWCVASGNHKGVGTR